MTSKADFNARDWEAVTAAPALAATAVARADRGGTFSEGLSMARTYQQARAEGQTELLRELLASPPAVAAGQAGEGAVDLRDRAVRTVREASDLLREHASDAELIEFGDFVVAVCDAVARAHKEGGVLGFGGKEVSDKERAVVDAVLEALGPRPE